MELGELVVLWGGVKLDGRAWLTERDRGRSGLELEAADEVRSAGWVRP